MHEEFFIVSRFSLEESTCKTGEGPSRLMVNKAMMATASLAGRLSIDLTSSGQRLNPSRKRARGWLCQPMFCKNLNLHLSILPLVLCRPTRQLQQQS